MEVAKDVVVVSILLKTISWNWNSFSQYLNLIIGNKLSNSVFQIGVSQFLILIWKFWNSQTKFA